MDFKKLAIAVTVAMSLGVQTSVFSREIVAGPGVTIGSSSLVVNAPSEGTLIKVVIRVVLPNGKVEERISNSRSVVFDVAGLDNGNYLYEAWALLSNDEGKYTTENSRGDFTVSDGVINIKQARPAPSGTDAEKTSFLDEIKEVAEQVSISALDFVFTPAKADNLTASSSNPLILFDDTTDASGTDNNTHDWVIQATDAAGSATFEIIDDIEDSGGWDFETVFEIQHADVANGGDTKNSIVIDKTGNISMVDSKFFMSRVSGKLGLGTITPEAGIHAKYSGKNGLIRMEDTNNSTWDFGQVVVGGGSASDGDFVISIANNGNGGTTGNQLTIKDENGMVGLGTADPVAKLDVRGDIGATFNGSSGSSLNELFKMSVNNSNASKLSDTGFVMENAREGFSWAFRTLEGTEGFAASKQGTGEKEFELRNTTNVAANVSLHLANGASNVNGQWLQASSRSYKKNIHDLSGEDAMKALRGLTSVQYQFKRDASNEKMVGFIAEDIPELLAVKGRKNVDPLKIVAVLTKAIQVQDKALLETNKRIKGKDSKIATMEAKINQLEKVEQRLTKLESILKRLKIDFPSVVSVD